MQHWQDYIWWRTWLFKLIIYILLFPFISKGKSESIISLPVNRPCKGLFPSCSVWMLLSMFIMLNPELQNKTHSASICRKFTHWGRPRHYFAILLIQYGAQQRALFNATLISLCPLDPTSRRSPCWKYSAFRLQTGAAGHCIAFTLSNTHIRSASTAV